MRSAAEQEIRTAVVDRLRRFRPTSRIIHEVNNAVHGTNRFDVVAVGLAEIITVEIKSKKDKLDRAPAQIKAMRGCSHHVISAIHEKFLVEAKTNKFAAHYERDGYYYRGSIPPEVGGSTVWTYPELARAIDPKCNWESKWKEPEPLIQMPLPAVALAMLWRSELCNLCGNLGVQVPKRATRQSMINALRWQRSGGDLTKGICAALRLRNFAEADSPIGDDGDD